MVRFMNIRKRILFILLIVFMKNVSTGGFVKSMCNTGKDICGMFRNDKRLNNPYTKAKKSVNQGPDQGITDETASQLSHDGAELNSNRIIHGKSPSHSISPNKPAEEGRSVKERLSLEKQQLEAQYKAEIKQQLESEYQAKIYSLRNKKEKVEYELQKNQKTFSVFILQSLTHKKIMQDKHSSTIREKQNKIDDLDANLKAREKEIIKVEEDITKLKANLAEKRNEIITLDTNVKEKAKQVTQLNRSLQEKQKEITELNANVKTRKEQLKKLSKTLEETHSQYQFGIIIGACGVLLLNIIIIIVCCCWVKCRNAQNNDSSFDDSIESVIDESLKSMFAINMDDSETPGGEESHTIEGSKESLGNSSHISSREKLAEQNMERNRNSHVFTESLKSRERKQKKSTVHYI